jgi:DNA repair exonuclease SbcCD ATPase subunit
VVYFIGVFVMNTKKLYVAGLLSVVIFAGNSVGSINGEVEAFQNCGLDSKKIQNLETNLKTNRNWGLDSEKIQNLEANLEAKLNKIQRLDARSKDLQKTKERSKDLQKTKEKLNEMLEKKYILAAFQEITSITSIPAISILLATEIAKTYCCPSGRQLQELQETISSDISRINKLASHPKLNSAQFENVLEENVALHTKLERIKEVRTLLDSVGHSRIDNVRAEAIITAVREVVKLSVSDEQHLMNDLMNDLTNSYNFATERFKVRYDVNQEIQKQEKEVLGELKKSGEKMVEGLNSLFASAIHPVNTATYIKFTLATNLKLRQLNEKLRQLNEKLKEKDKEIEQMKEAQKSSLEQMKEQQDKNMEQQNKNMEQLKKLMDKQNEKM